MKRFGIALGLGLGLMAGMARPEPIGTAARLPDREFGNRPRWRGLPLARKRGTNERSMHRTFFVFAIGVACFVCFAFGHSIVFGRESGSRVAVVDVLIALEPCGFDRRRAGEDLEIIGVLGIVVVAVDAHVVDIGDVADVVDVVFRASGLRRRRALWSAAGSWAVAGASGRSQSQSVGTPGSSGR